ncbi:MAG: diacylglycerol kinase [Alphaproteobacteria bacterium]|nr:diacylglycerol kinase [Alphaproteobacteria bacterium]
MMKSKLKGIKRILKAFIYSYDGFKAAFKSEAAFRQDIFFCLVFGASLFFMPFSPFQSALIVFSLFFILFAELTNTAVETAIDRIGDEYNDLSKKAKDIGSSIVLLSFINFFTVYGIFLYAVCFN